MNTVKWTCKSCEVPNIFVYDNEKGGQHALTCIKCGGQGHFDPVKETVLMRYAKNDIMSTCSTAMCDSNMYMPVFRDSVEDY